MMEGVLVKMKTELNNPIRYYLTFPSMFVRVNELIGKTITFTHTGYCCLNCGSNETIFRQGFCKRCFFETPTFVQETKNLHPMKWKEVHLLV